MLRHLLRLQHKQRALLGQGMARLIDRQREGRKPDLVELAAFALLDRFTQDDIRLVLQRVDYSPQWLAAPAASGP